MKIVINSIIAVVLTLFISSWFDFYMNSTTAIVQNDYRITGLEDSVYTISEHREFMKYLDKRLKIIGEHKEFIKYLDNRLKTLETSLTACSKEMEENENK